MKEKPFELKVREYIRSLGGWEYKVWAGGVYAKAGIPDILACIDGLFIAIEVKSDRGKPSALQLRNIRVIREAGGYARVLYPKEFQDFKEELNAYISTNGKRSGGSVDATHED